MKRIVLVTAAAVLGGGWGWAGPTVPMPQGERLDARQMKKLATAAASVYRYEGHRFLSGWSREYCANAPDIKMTLSNGGVARAYHCLRVRGKARGNKTFELQEAKLTLRVNADATVKYMLGGSADTMVTLGDLSFKVGGDGAVGRLDWKQYYLNLNFDFDVRRNELDFWLNYQGTPVLAAARDEGGN